MCVTGEEGGVVLGSAVCKKYRFLSVYWHGTGTGT